jgi:hypothetical protein
MVQTGANSLSGGVHSGKSIFRYHPPGCLVALTTMGVPLAPEITCNNAQVTGDASKRDDEGEGVLVVGDLGVGADLVVADLVREEEKAATG